MTKDDILKELMAAEGRYISGAALADVLHISRTAVWKAIKQLRGEGYPIESVTKRGYRLMPGADVLSEAMIRKYLDHQELRLRVYEQIDSTNTALKTLAAAGEEAGLALVAAEQTAGRGRMGRSFYSPPGTGLYLSLLLRPAISAAQAGHLTACAAVAVAEALEEFTGRRTLIKWVNDVLLDGKKVCGILTEAALDCESGMLHYAVVGVGINVSVPADGFAAELREVAGAVFDAAPPPELRSRLAAAVLDKLIDCCAPAASEQCRQAYRDRSLVLGRAVSILRPGCEPVPAEAIDLDRDYALIVRMPDGSLQRINSGEVSIRPR